MEKDRNGYLTDPSWRGQETALVVHETAKEALAWLERRVSDDSRLCLRWQWGNEAGDFWHYVPMAGAQARVIVWRQTGYLGTQAAHLLADDLALKGFV